MFRYTVGRWFVHFGIAIMPNGRTKTELVSLLESWARMVYNTNRNGQSNTIH